MERGGAMSEHDWLEEEEVSLHALCVNQAKILTGVANALRGDPPDLHHWSHHGLAQRARDVVDEVKRLREETEQAKELYRETLDRAVAAERENKRLREIVEILVEYAEELLGVHLVGLGETTRKNREIAQMMREDIAAARAALRGQEAHVAGKGVGV